LGSSHTIHSLWASTSSRTISFWFENIWDPFSSKWEGIFGIIPHRTFSIALHKLALNSVLVQKHLGYFFFRNGKGFFGLFLAMDAPRQVYPRNSGFFSEKEEIVEFGSFAKTISDV
jgi:hypothetical protein